LQKSGFVKKPDGFLYDKDGHKVEFDMLAGAGGTFMPAVAGYVTNDLKKLGMKVNFQEVEFNSLINKVSGSKDWEACLFGLTGDPMEPNNGSNVVKSDGRLHLYDIREQNEAGKTVVTDARPWETQIDQIYNSGAEEFDEAKRKQLYGEAQKILYEQAPFIYLCSPMDIVATRNTILNYVPTQLAGSQQTYGLHNLDEIYKGK
jgi:peptide/nickel transport system substrate-binding protein